MKTLTKIILMLWICLAILSFVSAWFLPHLVVLHIFVDTFFGLINSGIIIASVPAWKEAWKQEED